MPKPPPGFEWDDRKAAANHASMVSRSPPSGILNFEGALVTEDLRADYGEVRLFALGRIERTIHALVFTHRKEKGRIISLRKASAQERAAYLAAGGA